MNTNPDDPQLARWLDDAMHGEELAAFEAAMANQPEALAARAADRQWRELIGSVLPAEQAPPYPDFFNARVLRTIREQSAAPTAVARKRFAWSSLFMPLAACAGMVLALFLGAQSHRAPAEVVIEGAPRAIPVEPFVYTPESGVMAEYFASANASATVIVLNGVAAIPDSTDFSMPTSQLDAPRDHAATAEIEPEDSDVQSL